MAKLRHLALLTHQPDKLADFYEPNKRHRDKFSPMGGAVSISILNSLSMNEATARPGY